MVLELADEQVFGMGTSPLLRFYGLTSSENDIRDLDECVSLT